MSDQAHLGGKSILLIVGGGIAAYKSLELVRLVVKAGGSVRAILTRSGHEFVTPLSLSHLTGEKVHTDLFDIADEIEMGHIELSRSTDLLVVAPATADLMAKMAGGHADDLASTALLATDKRVLLAPAMNVRMWHHPATQRNLKRLTEDGVNTVGPNEGDMACGEYGFGRMAEPDEILAAISGLLGEQSGPLVGRKALVTAGPTHEPIDPVRYIANRSSGKQGYAIAAALARAGAEVTLVSGPTHLATPDGVRRVDVETAAEMMTASEQAGAADVAVFAAAVADWRVSGKRTEKLKKGRDGTPNLSFEENPDILATMARRSDDRPRLVIGFAAETENVVDNAKDKLARKGADWIVANDVSPGTGVMGGDRNRIHLVRASGTQSWPEMGKDAVAERLVGEIAAVLGNEGGA